LLDDIDHDFGFIDGNKLLLLFRHRLGLGWLWRTAKHFCQFAPEAIYFLSNSNSLVNRCLDLHERCLSLFVKLATFFDCGNASICSKEKADRVNV
jgi:hypothetical protein